MTGWPLCCVIGFRSKAGSEVGSGVHGNWPLVYEVFDEMLSKLYLMVYKSHGSKYSIGSLVNFHVSFQRLLIKE